MARKIGMSTNIQLRKHQLNNLVQLLMTVKGEHQMFAILNTLMTTSERESIAQRLHIYLKLHQGLNYFDIETTLGVSPNTITKALDLYHKNGSDNHEFNLMINNFKEPRFSYEIPVDYPNKLDRIGKPHIPGTFRF